MRVARLLLLGSLGACALALVFVAAPAAQNADIVLYAADASAISGNWARLSSTTGAGGSKMTSTDEGWATLSAPLASPRDYFEVEFEATAGVAYRLWTRLRAAAGSKHNDSLWVQFSAAVDQHGRTLWPIGSTSGLLVNLEDCYGCGLSGWGWQDNAWWLGDSSVVRFHTSGRQTLRVQTREDGVDVDQIVLSPATYFWTAPGAVRDDGVVLPRSGATSLLRAPYLQHVTESSAVVVWTTRQAGQGEVRLSDPRGAVRSIWAQSRTFHAAQTGLPHDFHQHEAQIHELDAATRYGFEIHLDGVRATTGSDAFTTAPRAGTGSVRFIAFGDSGVGSTAQRQLAAQMTADRFDLAIHAGDVAYGNAAGTGGGSYQQYDDWAFGMYASWLRRHPFFPAIGNHDDEIGFARAYRDVFVLPENGRSAIYPDHAERYYSFDYGPVHFVSLDTERAFSDPARRQEQLAWLDADLGATPQPWRVVYMHRPPYSSGTHHGSSLAVRQAFSPLFEKHGVQLAIAAHEHNYERTVPLREHSAGGHPVTYVVTGGGGAGLYPAGSAAWTAVSASAHHYVRFEAGLCELRGEAVRGDGSTFDVFRIDRCGQTPPPEPPPAESKDVVLYATDVGTVSGNWARLPSSSGAANTKMTSEDRGWSSTEGPLASPSDFFEASFDAPAGTYRLWLRLRAAADSKFNDSVWVQFSDAVTSSGAPSWRIGTDRALLVNLEDCWSCGLSGWGWQDNSWWLNESSVVRFAAAGRHTIRVQTREDGVDVDQIVLSPVRFFESAPGAVRNDHTIVPR